MHRLILTGVLALGLFTLSRADTAPKPIRLHVVPTPIKSYRLLAMSRDDEGFIWAGSIHQAIHRYDPRTGQVQTVQLPVKATASACICVGKKVYILGQSYPRLLIYDRTAKKFHEKNYPSAKPDVWYGTEAIGGRCIYLFDRGGAGVIKWDTRTDTGKALRYPYQTPLPSSGHYEPSDKALWCRVGDFSGGKYVPLGLARLDATTDAFTGWYPFPKADADLKPDTDLKTTFYLPYTLRGKLVPFDFKAKRWCRFLRVPRFGDLFGFIGGGVNYRGRWYFSLSTYNGTEKGCDGKPYHFCNAVLEFDPVTRRFDFPTLEAKDAYYQVSYMLSAGGEFFATGSNIREADGRLNQARAGEVVFWQTRRHDGK